MGREGAVLAVALAGARERKRQIARERDASHRDRTTNVRSRIESRICSSRATRAGGPRQDHYARPAWRPVPRPPGSTSPATEEPPTTRRALPGSSAGAARRGRFASRRTSSPSARPLTALRSCMRARCFRAAQTAALVGEHLRLKPIPDDRLVETDAGDWTDRLFADVRAESPELFDTFAAGDPAFAFPGGESFAEQESASPRRSPRSKKAPRRPSSSATAWSSVPRCTAASDAPTSPGARRTVRSSRSTRRRVELGPRSAEPSS